ncbi:RNA polymerase sigma factor [Peribacillus alkalitolerans]|uniref:RNA polymerase sigma factor n=1 Tax=Peribacillus alkalitolerans TaxID=1550385 RepID=UPI0013D1F7FF|nr:RNA polymerase sigma factor [Peribacillus alkalitolerans]
MEEELISRAKRGDKTAMTELIRQYAPIVEKFAYQMGNSRNDIEDITQEVFIKVFRFINQFSQAKFTTWLYKITLNVTKDYYRKKQSQTKKLFFFQRQRNVVIEPGTEEGVLQSEEDRYLHQCILELDEKYRIPIILYYFHDCKYDEIADILNTNLSTIKTRLLRGKEQLKKRLEQDNRKEGGQDGR